MILLSVSAKFCNLVIYPYLRANISKYRHKSIPYKALQRRKEVKEID